MDPLTALSLTSNVIQIVDFSARLVSQGREIYHSTDGLSTQNVDTELITWDLKILNERLQKSYNGSKAEVPLSRDDQSLMRLCENCIVLSNDILLCLEKAKVAGKHRKWKSGYQALKSVVGDDDLEKYTRKLATYRNEINLHITVSLR